ncbi:hypothetical protein QFC22_003929 [Naganishia vaughanmartiniae]|uniref:Uncharacterized protein n=1 Tax=Naganishia vaughanmartiniae TaxID=1424756 RepID=A0ACC2X5T5_9TREE|nr:hypothetical protein QFC22_003929 [Naganishia vaughanmartiniae]
MQSNISSAAVARPQTHRAMSSSAALSPYADSLRRQAFDAQGSNLIGQPFSIAEGSYPQAIGSARLDGQVVSPPPSGSSHERHNLQHTLSGGMPTRLPAPTEQSPALERFRGHFEHDNASSAPVANNTSPFARSGLGFGGQLANSGGRPSFGITSSVSATASTFSNSGSFDRDGHRLQDGAPMGFHNGSLNVPMPGASARSRSFTEGQRENPKPQVSVMPSLTSSVALDHYPSGSRQPRGNFQQNRDSSRLPDTFSETSSAPASPEIESSTLSNGHGRDGSQSRLPAVPHSPPHAPATASRSRSQSLAPSGLRPTLGSGLIPMPMSTISQHTEIHHPQATIGNTNGPTSPWGAPTSPYGRGDAFGASGARVTQDDDVTPTNGPDGWQQHRQAERERERRTHADLANSLQAVLGDLQDQNVEDHQIQAIGNGSGGVYPNGNVHGNINGHGNANPNGYDNGNGNGNGNGLNARSGASSRRHSVSVVAGPSARTRGFGLAGFGFSDANNTNVVHRHGPVHQAERESIYPQPFGGPNGRFRAGEGDQPPIATLGSMNLGGYTDDDLLAHGVNNQLSLRMEGDPIPVNVSSSSAVPIGHGTSTMTPFSNSYHPNGLAPGSTYGMSPSGRQNLGRTPSQSGASPQYHNAESYMHAAASGPGPVGSPQVTSDRFRNGNNLGSPRSEWPTGMHEANVMSSIVRDPSSFRSLAPGPAAFDPMAHAGNRAIRAPHGSFVAAPGHPGHMPQGAAAYTNGHSNNAAPQQPILRNNGPPFAQQRAPGQPMNVHGSFQPMQARGPPGMGAPRPTMPPHGMSAHPVSPSDPRFVTSYAAPPPPVLYRQSSAQGNGYRNGFAGPANGAFRPSLFVGPMATASALAVNSDDHGKGVSLDVIPPDTKLYIVEFKAGRTDLFYAANPRDTYAEGDVVLVEADRGTDLGTIVNGTVSLANVQDFVEARKEATAQAPSQQQQAQAMAQLGRLQTQLGGIEVGHADPADLEAVRGLNKEILPKGIFSKATLADLRKMEEKLREEDQALNLCRSKVIQRGLPMQVHAAEFQWDHRKLTFYFTAARRIDFRDLVKELFRIHKTRIWMACLGGSYLLTDEADGIHEAPNYHTRA